MLLDLYTRDEEFECRTFLLSVYTCHSIFYPWFLLELNLANVSTGYLRMNVFSTDQLSILTLTINCLQLVHSKEFNVFIIS